MKVIKSLASALLLAGSISLLTADEAGWSCVKTHAKTMIRETLKIEKQLDAVPKDHFVNKRSVVDYAKRSLVYLEAFYSDPERILSEGYNREKFQDSAHYFHEGSRYLFGIIGFQELRGLGMNPLHMVHVEPVHIWKASNCSTIRTDRFADLLTFYNDAVLEIGFAGQNELVTSEGLAVLVAQNLKLLAYAEVREEMQEFIIEGLLSLYQGVDDAELDAFNRQEVKNAAQNTFLTWLEYAHPVLYDRLFASLEDALQMFLRDKSLSECLTDSEMEYLHKVFAVVLSADFEGDKGLFEDAKALDIQLAEFEGQDLLTEEEAFAVSLVKYLASQRPILREYDLTENEPAENTVRLQAVLRWEEVLWVDARTEKAHSAGHIPRALNLNTKAWDRQVPEVLTAWQPGVPVVVYCDSRTCDASYTVADRLRNEMGSEEVYVLRGGWEAWLEAQE